VIIDWTEKGAVGPVRNQGTCGSGVLYATLESVEGLSKVTTGTLLTFSAQQLIDCVFGCTGSDIATVFDYYKSHSKVSLI
jgi:C1A family cysteine protease